MCRCWWRETNPVSFRWSSKQHAAIAREVSGGEQTAPRLTLCPKTSKPTVCRFFPSKGLSEAVVQGGEAAGTFREVLCLFQVDHRTAEGRVAETNVWIDANRGALK